VPIEEEEEQSTLFVQLNCMSDVLDDFCMRFSNQSVRNSLFILLTTRRKLYVFKTCTEMLACLGIQPIYDYLLT
jgi:hypothetical protein